MRALLCSIGLVFCGVLVLQAAERPLLVAQPVRLVGERLLALPLRALDPQGNGVALQPDQLRDLRIDGEPLDWWQLEFRAGQQGLPMAPGPGLTLRRNLELLGGLKGLPETVARGAHRVSVSSVRIEDFRGERALSVAIPREDLPRFLGQMGRRLLQTPQLESLWSPQNAQPLLSASQAVLERLHRSWGHAEGLRLPQAQWANGEQSAALLNAKTYELRGGLAFSPGDLARIAQTLPKDHPLRRRAVKRREERLAASDQLHIGAAERPSRWKVTDQALKARLALYQQQLGQEGFQLALEMAGRTAAAEPTEQALKPAPPTRNEVQTAQETLVFSRIGRVIYLDAELVGATEPSFRYRPDQLKLMFLDLGPDSRAPGRVRPQVRRALGQVQPDGINYLLFPLSDGLVDADGPLTLRSGERVWRFTLHLAEADRGYLQALKNRTQHPWIAQEQALQRALAAEEWGRAAELAKMGIKALEPGGTSLSEPLAARWLLAAGRAQQRMGNAEQARRLWRRLVQEYPLSPQSYEAWNRLSESLLN